MRAWILAGLALVLLGFAATLVVDVFRAEPVVSELPPRVPEPRGELEAVRRVALERDAALPDPATGSRGNPAPQPAAPPAGTREEIARYPDGSVRARSTVDSAGRQHGRHTSFHPSGAILEVGEYEQGQKHGLWRAFHESGALREESTWELGVQRGTLRQWDAEGQLLRDAQVHGQLEGLTTTWYANGQLESRGHYSGGRREGRWQFWLQNGELDPARSGEYRSDQRVDD